MKDLAAKMNTGTAHINRITVEFKSGYLQIVLIGGRDINRITVEFKFVSMPVLFSDLLILIESQWNLNLRK